MSGLHEGKGGDAGHADDGWEIIPVKAPRKELNSFRELAVPGIEQQATRCVPAAHAHLPCLCGLLHLPRSR